jgi:2-polyprenyl-3-methyl-5-hydroxy-6-metoxy-1,4-benzoquinol methylase
MGNARESNRIPGRAGDDIIRTHSQPDCYLCGQQGEPLYSGLTDRLFGAPGKWDLKRCPNAACGLVWLNPMPIEAEVAKAYRTYYTHGEAIVKSDPFRKLYRVATAAYVKTYCSVNGTTAPLRTLIAAQPIRAIRSIRDELDFPRRYFAKSNGRMLDVGCGNGDLIGLAQTYGWEAEGIDVDARALGIARSKGLNVRLGTLLDQEYPDSTSNLITMNHVLEHMHDPIGMLSECHRALRADGLLIVSTPNTASSGHHKFGPDWRGLEPPRHLMLFNPRTLAEAARRAAFKQTRVISTLRINIMTDLSSRRIRHNSDPAMVFSSRDVLQARLNALALQVRLWFSPLLGDELLLEATK